MDVRLSTRTVLELTRLLATAAAAPGATAADRHELAHTRAQVATRMPPVVEVLVLAGVLREAADRLALDLATQAACDRWSASLAAQLTAPPARQPLAIAS